MLFTSSRALARGMIALLLACSAHTTSSSAQDWLDSRTFGPFVVRSEFRLDGREELLDELGSLSRDLADLLAISPGEVIEVYLFRSRQSYAAVLSKTVPTVPYRRALYIKRDGPGQVYAYQSAQLETDLRHECTHALLHAALPMVPLWLDEGLAEYFEVPAPSRAFDNPHLVALRWSVMFGSAPPLVPLENKGDLSEMAAGEYRAAWAWAHFMIHGPRPARQELIAFLADIRLHTPPGLLSQRLERRLPGVQQRIAEHFRNWKR